MAERSKRSDLASNGLVMAAGIGAVFLAAFLARPRMRYSFKDKAVIITGGSRGLGLVLARELSAEGAKLALAARDRDELQRAGEELRIGGGEVIEIECDVRKRDDAERAVRTTVERFGAIDVLVNNAGVIQVGPLESQTEDDFRKAMDTHFWGPLHTMRAAIEFMRPRREGRIVNISSIGGKVAVPHLAPYCASKFALAGLSSSMRAELAKDGIVVTSVYPGLMRTGSHVNAEFKGQQKKEFALFSVLDALPVSSIKVERAARQIIEASRSGRAELIISQQAKFAAMANALLPELTASILGTSARLLPGPGKSGKTSLTGLESSSSVSPSWITANIDQAAQENNELKPGEKI